MAAALLLIRSECPATLSAQAGDTSERVRRIFAQAQAAENARDLDQASRLYREITKLDPGIAEVWSNLGMALYNSQHDDEAIQAFDKAALLKPTLEAPHLYKGESELRQGKPAEAVHALVLAMALNDHRLETRLALSDAYVQSGQFQKGIRILQKTSADFPGTEEAGSRLSVAYLDWGRALGESLKKHPGLYERLMSDQVSVLQYPQTAETKLRETVDAIPDSVEAKLALVSYLLSTHPTPEAIHASAMLLSTAVHLAPHSLEIAVGKIRLLVVQQNVDQAAQDLQSLIAADHLFVAANFDTLTTDLPPATIASLQRKLDEPPSPPSIESFSAQRTKLHAVASRRPLTRVERIDDASAAWHLGQFSDVLQDLDVEGQADGRALYWMIRACQSLAAATMDATVRAHPDSVRTHLLKADLALQHGDYPAADAEYRAAMTLRPDDVELKLQYVRFLETAKEPEHALQVAKDALTAYPNNAELNFHAGHLLLNDDAATAIPYLETAVSHQPHTLFATVDLASAYAAVHRLDDAIKTMAPALPHDTDGSLHYRVARWYQQLGKAEEAAEMLTLSRQLKESSKPK